MRDIHPARLTRSRRAHLLAVALLGGAVLVTGCTGNPGSTPAPTRSARTAAVPGCLQPPVSCYAPRVLRAAYGIQPLLGRGIDGRGETVTVLAAPPTNAPGRSPASDIRKDLAAFDRMFGLPAARVETVTGLAGSASPWQVTLEEVQDTEIVHMAAPAATLRVVLLPANLLQNAATATADLLAGLRLAVSGTDVASIGFSLGERFFTKAQVAQLHAILRQAAAHHVTVVASSGDSGAFSNPYGGTPVKEVSLPAADPLVLAVGGTTLTANTVTGSYTSETVWKGEPPNGSALTASGGGFSHLYARPGYQGGVPGISTARGVPDVAGDADQQGGAPIVLAGGSTFAAIGTDAAASLWAGIISLADQDAHHGLGLVNPAIYRIARGPSYHTAFHDITTGSNKLAMPYPAGTAGYGAGPGWDPATGWGSPNAQVLVPLLAHSAGHGKA
jgi:subtilase family serine protease